MIKMLQYLLVHLRIVKTDKKKFKDGLYKTHGINKANPASYIFLLIASIVCGVIAFFKTIYDVWVDSLLND